MKITKEILFLEKSPNGYALSGKTGSNYYDEDRKMRLGWFVSHLKKEDQEYLVVTNFSDVNPQQESTYGGFQAKAITKKILENLGLW